MPNVLIPIDVTYESITRRMVHSVVEQVMRLTGLSTDIPIRFYGALGKNYQPGSTVDGGENTFETARKVTVTAIEEYKDDAVINTPVRYQDAKPIFEDPALDILLKPVYSHTQVTLDFTYRAPTRLEAERWRDDVKVRAGDGRQANLHELRYHYPVPAFPLVVLHHLYTLREQQAGYGESYSDWLKRCFTPQATTLANMNGQKTLLVINETQIGIQGWFDFTEPPQAQTGPDGSTWLINFTYRLNYQKAVSTNFLYPLVVHNQFISDDFYSDEKPYTLEDRPQYAGDIKQSFDSIADMYKKPADPLGGLRFPEFDDWVPETVPNYTTSLINWMMQVEAGDPTLLLDLSDMGEWEFTQGFIEFLTQEAPYISRRGNSFITFTLFENLLPMTEPSLVMDESLLLRSTEPMDLRKTYHLRMGLITQYGLFTDRAIRAMEDAGRTTLHLFQCLVNTLDVEYAETLLIGGYKLPRWYIEWFFKYLREHEAGTTGRNVGGGSGGIGEGLSGEPSITGPGGTTGGYYIDWPLVGILTIIAKRRPEEE